MCFLVTLVFIALSIKQSVEAIEPTITLSGRPPPKMFPQHEINQIKRLWFIMILLLYITCIAAIIEITASENDCS